MKKKVRNVFDFLMQGFAYMFYVPRTRFRDVPKFPKTAKEAFEMDMQKIREDAKRYGEKTGISGSNHMEKLSEAEQLATELGVPPTMWVIISILDQTIGYFADEKGDYGSWTTKHPDATLYKTQIEAEESMKRILQSNEGIPEDELWVEEVPDFNEFKAREDTW